MQTPNWLERTAERSAECSWTFGALLAEFGRSEAMTHEQMANLLECEVTTLQWLALCRAPEAKTFAEDVRRIADRFSLNTSKLAQLIRRTEATAALRLPARSGEEAMLLAARDRNEGKNP